jgi:DNA-binding GntR family transcriptional regulator
MFSTLAAETMLCMLAFDDRYIRPPTAVEEHQRLLDRLLGGDLAEMVAEIDRHLTEGFGSLTKARLERDRDGSAAG